MRFGKASKFFSLSTAMLVTSLGVVSIAAAPAQASLAWADDPCEQNGGQLAVAPDISVQQPDQHPIAYAACADGTLLHHGNGGAGTYEKVEGINTDSFIDVASTRADNLYALTEDGRVVTVGETATHYGDLGGKLTYPAVALEMTPSGQGYWVVTASGQVVGFGDAQSMGPARDTSIYSDVSAFAAAPAGGGWLLTEFGEIVPVGGAADHGDAVARIGADDYAVGIVADARSGGFWVVTANGLILGFGGAPDEDAIADCHAAPGGQPPFTGAVGDKDPDSIAPIWTYSFNGGICGFDPYLA